MAENSTIEWTDHTWSPWIGCTKVSPACDGCYAEHLMDTRMGRVTWGPHGERSRTSAGYWRKPLAWNREAEAAGRMLRVFPSLCDPFDNRADPAVRREWFDLIRATPHLLWLLLTKRPQNVVAMVEAAGGMPGNLALGATCEDQKRADLNVPALLVAKHQLGARLAFLSCEPLLGPIDLTRIATMRFRGAELLNGLTGELEGMFGDPCGTRLPGLDWVITGGETDQGSHKARPSHPDWYRSIRDQCAAAGVPYLHKQNGEWRSGIFEVRGEPGRYALHWPHDVGRWAYYDYAPRMFDRFGIDAGMTRVGKKAAGRLLDGRTHDGMPEARP